MKNSLYQKIFIIFGSALFLLVVLFAVFGHIQRENALKKAENTQLTAIHYLLSLYDKNRPPQDLKQFFSNFNLEILNDKNKIATIVSNGDLVFQQATMLGEFISYRYSNTLFLFIQNETFSVCFESLGTKNINDPLWIGFIIMAVLLFWLYFSVIKSLKPLKRLNSDIKKFASGNMDIIIPKPKGVAYEIVELSDEFARAVEKIRELMKSRQLFLRTIMHELKTPIGKGRIVSEMIDDETQKGRLVSIFERLEILINEFAKIEQLLSKSYSLNLQECHMSLVIEQAKDMMMLENFDEKVAVNILEDVVVNVDFQVFSLAIKNLIDNALKYSEDRHVDIYIDSRMVKVTNKGAPLPISIDHYKQAFIRNKDNQKGGLGLGLYIIDKICELHKFALDYRYSEGAHNFIILFDGNTK